MENIINKINRDTFVISDHHFGHKNINKFEPIRLKRAEELGYIDTEKMMIDRWNSVVGKNDTVLYLGDFAFSGVEKHLSKLNGNIIFIYGNHDKGNLSTEFIGVKGLHIQFNEDELVHSMDDKLYSGIIKEIDGKMVMFCHYPLEYNDSYDMMKEKIVNRIVKFSEYYDNFGCDLLIHGHVHSNSKEIDNHINVSCEELDFIPKRIKDLI